MKSTYSLPSFDKKAYTIDFSENTPDGQNTLHGTLIVINQNDVTDDDTDSIPVNEPIYIPEYINPINVNINFKPPPTNLACPVTAEKLAYSSNNRFLQKYRTYDRVWLMATFGQVRHSIYKPFCGSDIRKTYQRTRSCKRHHWHYARYGCFKYIFHDCPRTNESYTDISTWFWCQLWQANN